MNTARPIDNWVGFFLCGLLFAWSRTRALLGGPAQPGRRETTPPPAGAPRTPPRRILAIKFYGLGNIAMLLPVLGALRRVYPDVEIDFLTMAANRVLLERSGAAHRVVEVDVGGLRPLLQSLWRFLRLARRRRYDLVIDFEQFVKLSAILAYLSGAPQRVGFNTDGQHRGLLYTTRVVYTDSEHQSRIFARLLKPIGAFGELIVPEIATKPEEEATVERLLGEAGATAGQPLVVVHVGSGPNFYRVAVKRWPIPHFAELCDRLVEQFGAAVILTGKGEEERGLIDEVRARMRHKPVDLCDRLRVMDLVALLKRVDLAVTNDTSVMHLTSLVGTPVAAFFGPTSPLHYGPWNEHDHAFYRDLYCSPCITNYNLKVSRCASPVCVREIGVDEVMQVLGQKYLGGGKPA